MNAVPIAAGGSNQISTIWITGEVPSGEAGRAWTNGGTIALDVRPAMPPQPRAYRCPRATARSLCR
jgi:hypothetical protein